MKRRREEQERARRRAKRTKRAHGPKGREVMEALKLQKFRGGGRLRRAEGSLGDSVSLNN